MPELFKKCLESLMLLLAAGLLLGCAAGSSPEAPEPFVHDPVSAAERPATERAALAYEQSRAIFHPVLASHGMVASDHAMASRVGLQVLEAGGNAVDAAVATALMLAVVQPYAGNLGGGGFMLLHLAASGQTMALDFRERAPAAASEHMFLNDQGELIDGRSLHSHLAVAVPGTVAGLVHALANWGTRPLAELAAPAIRLADRGFPVSPTLARVLAQNAAVMGQWPATRAIFWRDGRPLQVGDWLVQKDLARSLRLIAGSQGRDFYEGSIAAAIVAQMQAHGGLIRAADLRQYRVSERAPVSGNYRGYRILTMPPPSSGGVHLVQMLNMLENWPLHKWGAGSARIMHYMVESMKLAYADRARYLGDADFVPVPVQGLTAKSYARQLIRGIDPQRARPAIEIHAGRPPAADGENTTHFSIVDAQGNAVALTYTLNTNFGSGIVAAGTGILLNNEMDDFTAKPGAANVYGLIGGKANTIAPGKRPLSSMTPTIVLKEGQPYLVTGTPGGAHIITTVLQTIVNAIDFGMNPAESAAQPRFHHQLWPDELRVERGISPDTFALLRDLGHRIVQKPTMGRTQTIQIQNGVLAGASDPRAPDALTLGY